MTTDTFSVGTLEVAVGELRKALSQQYEALRHQTHGPITRLASFTLMVISHGEGEAELQSLLESLTRSHPSRLLWCRLDRVPTWEESVARVTLGCRQAGQQVCTEQVVIDCGGEAGRLPSLLMSLLRSALPTHLIWWKAGSLESSLFDRLSDRARLILWQPEDDYSEPLPELSRLWDDPYKAEHVVYPLVWHCLSPVRERIAAAYDKGPLVLELPRGKGLMSLLLTRWLSSSLESPWEKVGARVWRCRGVEIRWVSDEEMAEPRLLVDGERCRLALDPYDTAARSALDSARRDRVFQRLLNWRR